MGVLSRATIAAGQRNEEKTKNNIQDLTFSLVRYDRMRRDSNLLYKPRVRTVSSSSSNNCSRRSSVICNTFDLEELEEVLVTFNEQMVDKEISPLLRLLRTRSRWWNG